MYICVKFLYNILFYLYVRICMYVCIYNTIVQYYMYIRIIKISSILIYYFRCMHIGENKKRTQISIPYDIAHGIEGWDIKLIDVQYRSS